MDHFGLGFYLSGQHNLFFFNVEVQTKSGILQYAHCLYFCQIFWSEDELELIRQSSLYRETINQKSLIEKEYLAIRQVNTSFCLSTAYNVLSVPLCWLYLSCKAIACIRYFLKFISFRSFVFRFITILTLEVMDL